jgi:hypothetical protein
MADSDHVDQSDRVLVGSLLLIGGGIAVLASPAVVAGATLAAGYAAFGAAGSLSMGIAGLGVWGAAHTVGPEQKADTFEALESTKDVVLSVHDPAAWAKNKMWKELTGKNEDAPDLPDVPKPTDSDEEWTSFTFEQAGDLMTKAGDKLLDTPEKQHTAKEISKESEGFLPKGWAENQCRVKDPGRDFLSSLADSSKDKKEPDMCKDVEPVSVNKEFSRAEPPSQGHHEPEQKDTHGHDDNEGHGGTGGGENH